MNGKSVVITEADFDRLRSLVDVRLGRSDDPTSAARLAKELSRSAVVSSSRVSRRVVTMNSRVRIRDLNSGESETYTLVYPQNADIDEYRLSVLAPLGAALLGAKVGDALEISTPAGVRQVKIERVLYQPEAAGDVHL